MWAVECSVEPLNVYVTHSYWDTVKEARDEWCRLTAAGHDAQVVEVKGAVKRLANFIETGSTDALLEGMPNTMYTITKVREGLYALDIHETGERREAYTVETLLRSLCADYGLRCAVKREVIR